MQIVINISEDFYRRLKAGDTNAGNTFHNTALEAIGNGMPLPKGHGDLIDRDALIQKQFIPNLGFELVDLDDLKTAPTIIEADEQDEA